MLSKLCARVQLFYATKRLKSLSDSDRKMAARQLEIEHKIKAAKSVIESTQTAGPTADALLSDVRWKAHLLVKRFEGELEPIKVMRLALLQAMKHAMVDQKMAQIELGIK